MHDRKMEIIQELMSQLQDEMKYGEDDLSERLGRKKPAAVEIMSVESEDPGLEKAEEMMGKDLDGDMEMGEDQEHAEMVMGEEMGPEEKLKQRLMKLRG